MDPRQYHFTYMSSNTAHQVAAPAPVPAGNRNFVFVMGPNGSMRPIQNAAGGLLPAPVGMPQWTAVRQAAQQKAAEEAKKKAAEEAKKKAAEEARKKTEAEKKKQDAARMMTSVSWAWDPITGHQKPVIPKGIDVPVPGYVYAYHHGNGDYRYYK